MANTKYTLCSLTDLSFNSQEDIGQEPSLLSFNGKNYASLEELDANEMPKNIFMNKPNVVIAYAGTKKRGGVDTGEPCVVVGVTEKVDISQLKEEEKIPSILPDGVITDVVVFSKIEAHGTCTDGGGDGCLDHATKHRPLKGGISAIKSGGTACTLGLVVKDNTTKRLVALTNNHCVGLLYDPAFKIPTYGSLAVAGNNMLQPSPSDGGDASDIYGTVVRAVALEFGTDSTQNNQIDCAISSIGTNDASTEILGIGDGPFSFASVSDYSVGTVLYKSGRTTGNTPPPTTTIISTNASVRVNYGPGGDKDVGYFTNQIAYSGPTRFTQGGDSGSVMLALVGGSYKVVALHFAGNSEGTLGIGNPINLVASGLNVSSWNGDIVVAENDSPSIMVDGICYQRVGSTTDPITHTVDDQFSSCLDCFGVLDQSSSSESSTSSLSSESSSTLNSSLSSSTQVMPTSSSISSISSSSISSISSSSDSSSTQLKTSSSSSDISASSSSSEFEDIFEHAVPKNLSLEVRVGNEIFLRWKAIGKATGYVIERKNGFADWEVLGETNLTSYLDVSLDSGKYYQYRVRGYLDA